MVAQTGSNQNPGVGPAPARIDGPAGAVPRRARTLLILALLAAFGPFSTDMYLAAFPEIAADLRTSASNVQLSLSLFFVCIAVSQLFYGPLSDALGRRRPLLGGLVLFMVAAAGCALAASIEAFILWRVAMAFGGAAGMVLSRAVVRDIFGAQGAAEAFSLLMLIMGVAPIIAPIAGAQVLLLADWRWIFWALLGFGATAFLAVVLGLPESLPAERRKNGAGGPGGAVRGFFPEYWRIATRRSFSGYALVLGCNAAALFTYITCSSHVFIDVFKVSPQGFSFFFGLNAVGLMGASAVNRWLVRRVAPTRILRGTLFAVCGAGVVLALCSLAGVFNGPGGFPLFVVLLFLTLASGGLVAPNATALALAPFGKSAGSASALLGTLQFGMGGVAGAIAGRFAATGATGMCVTLALCATAGLTAFHAAGAGHFSESFEA